MAKIANKDFSSQNIFPLQSGQGCPKPDRNADSGLTQRS